MTNHCFRALTFFIFLIQGALATDYTFSCWQNGWRKNPNDKSPDIFGIETNYYGFSLNVANFDEVKMGRIQNQPHYETALSHKTQKLSALPRAELLLAIEVKGTRYTAKTCAAGKASGVKKLSSVRLWESGRYLQHYDFLGLEFKDAEGQSLECDARLTLVAWPGSLTLTLHATPADDWPQSSLKLGLTSQSGSWEQHQEVASIWKAGEENSVSMTSVLGPKSKAPLPTVSVTSANGQNIPVHFDPKKNCLTASAGRLKRPWKTGYTGIRNYDDFRISTSETSGAPTTPFLLDLRSPANITGICPILCHEDGTPTGIPVQLSKNWHYKPMGNYLMAYAMLPTGKPANYLLRLAYGFYGTLPSASHAQLSLIGYGGKNAGNGRWDQLAIGCWGESICFDMDMSLVDVAITDIRMLMTRAGLKGKKWSWSDAGWGGDWLNLRDQNQKKYFQNHLKTAYLAHGPCLTKVKHEGFYGANQEVDFTAQIQTLRTDDYCRTFQRLSYTFTKDVAAENIWLFKLGRSFHYQSPRLAYGNLDGLISEHQAPNTLKSGQVLVDEVKLTGPAPHWIAFPEASEVNTQSTKPNGYRSLIIRDYRAIIDGKTYHHPVLKSPVYRANPTNLDIEILPPSGIRQFKKGDQIDLDLELITLPRIADDYYGPNESFHRHLTENPNSWQTTHREAKKNKLTVKVTGGKEIQNYPLVIKTDKPKVIFSIQGGAGAVPVQFQNLASRNGYQLHQIIDGKQTPFNQSVHGNDFWQTDYDPVTRTYTMTYNLPLDGLSSSNWVFKKTTRK